MCHWSFEIISSYRRVWCTVRTKHGLRDRRLAVRLREWSMLKTIMTTIDTAYPTLATAVPCFQREDHMNQLGALSVTLSVERHRDEGTTERDVI